MRTTLAVDEEIAKEFSKTVKEKGKVIFSITNSAIILAKELLNDGIDPKEALEFWKLFKLMGMMDVIPIPGYLNEEILNKLYKYEKEKLYEIFERTGEEVALKLKIYIEDIVSLLNLTSILVKFFPLKKIEVKEIDLRGSYRLILAGAGQSIVTTNCLLYFLKGFFKKYEIKINKEEVSLGMINLEFKV